MVKRNRIVGANLSVFASQLHYGCVVVCLFQCLVSSCIAFREEAILFIRMLVPSRIPVLCIVNLFSQHRHAQVHCVLCVFVMPAVALAVDVDSEAEALLNADVETELALDRKSVATRQGTSMVAVCDTSQQRLRGVHVVCTLCVFTSLFLVGGVV